MSDNTKKIEGRDIGILAMEIYFPQQCVKQSEMEIKDGVAPGKYTIGLGQTRLGFCSDREDINSICLTVVSQLMRKYGVSYENIGFLEVGTESLVDKSKSPKTHLMDLFAAHGNMSVEGITCTNACYGGTAALFNALNWLESPYSQGRLALVVAADIAVYAAGPARPTSGAGAVAMLLGPNASLVFDVPLRGTYMANVYDFYKPDMSSEYPYVDGPLSVSCFVEALDKCYRGYMDCYKKSVDAAGDARAKDKKEAIQDIATYVVFHAPYAKIVQKAAARLYYLDDQEHGRIESSCAYNEIEYRTKSAGFYAKSVDASLTACREIGNMYCASLYGGLLSLLSSEYARGGEEALAGKRIVLFSYGSGLASSMFSLTVRGDSGNSFGVKRMVETVGLHARLQQRTEATAEEFERQLAWRAQRYNTKEGFEPSGSLAELHAGTYYLAAVDSKLRRKYGST